MPNTITKQTIHDGDRNLVVKVNIAGDGSGDESSTELIDASSYKNAPSDLKIMRIVGTLSGFALTLEWNASANVDAYTIPGDEDVDIDFSQFGGLPNNAGSGKNGDIDFTTVGLGSEDGSFTLYMKKK